MLHETEGRVTASYAVVHLVSRELNKDLVGPQVIDHMAWQQSAPGDNAPLRVAVGFLEPARVAIAPETHRRVSALRRRAPDLGLAILPFVGRLGLRRNSAWLARRIRRLAGPGSVVLHCRGESAGYWGLALAEYLHPAGLVVDVRGAWPEELLFARGFDGISSADDKSRMEFDSAMARLRDVLSAAGSVISVSAGMLEWLRSLGVCDDKLHYVPCCVTRLAFDADVRERVRRELGLQDKLVVVYAGTVTRYQHIGDGVVAFFKLLKEHQRHAHLLCLTSDVEQMQAHLKNVAIEHGSATVLRVDQRATSAYLCAADAGLLLRAPSRINVLSQPTKLGEYLASGLPVVVSRGTGVVGPLVEAHDAGLQIDWFGCDNSTRRQEVARVVSCLTERSDTLRAGALTLCEREFLWSRYTDVVRDAFIRSLHTSR